MNNITNIRYGPLPGDSPYVKPFRMYYNQNGMEKNWDLLKVHDSVLIVIYNKTTDKLVFVKQFRPAVYYGTVTERGLTQGDTIDMGKYPAELGITIECCAGIVDKKMSLREIARDEVVEECGFNVSLDRIEEIMMYKSGVGTSGALQTMFYCEVTNDDKVNDGGGVDDELIEVIEMSIEDAKKMVSTGAQNPSPPSTLMGVLWFLYNKAPK